MHASGIHKKKCNGVTAVMFKKLNLRAKLAGLSDIYNFHEVYAQGRLISLLSALITAFYNVFITGIFYTGFLSMYGISITDFGIITFIPYIANCFSVFSGMILGKIKQRKRVLIASKIFYYAMYIIAITLMPQFVTDPKLRMYCFIAILFIAHAVYALFSPGFTTWFYNFYPADNERRTRYITLNHLVSSIMSCIVLLFSGILTDAVSGSPYQKTLILGFRYFAFVLVLIDVFMQSRAKEFPYPESPDTKLKEVFTLPFRYRKFMMCLIMMFAWSFISNLNNGLWNYHLLNHMHFSYTLLNFASMLYTVILLCSASLWQKMLRRFSWIKTFGITNLLWWPTEILFFCMTVDRPWMFLPLSITQNCLNVGFNLSYSNVLYMNLPEENSTTHIAFYTIGCNLFAFLGLMTGTWISSLTGDNTISVLGMDVYSVQFTTIARAVTMFTMGIVCTFKWRSFTREQDIKEIEERAAIEKVHREQRKKMFQQQKKRRLSHGV